MIENFIVIPINSILFILAVYWFWKANKILGGKLKNFVIWIIITMCSFSIYSTIGLFYYILGILVGDIWVIIRVIFGSFTLFSFAISAYQIKNIFK